MNMHHQPPRVLIVGSGFGGLEAARTLAHADVAVTLVDRSNHHLFQPLLYQVATAGMAAPAIAAPIRHLFRKQANLTTLLGEVVDVDATAREVRLANGGVLGYDHLIVAAGATHSYFGKDEWAAFAPGLKTLADAFAIRRRVLMSYEAAENEPDPARQRALLTFCVIGAGPTGVEMAGTLVEIARHTLKNEFRHIDPASAEVLLIEGGGRVLQAMPENLSQRAREQLEKLGVRVMLNARVTHIDATGLTIETPDTGAAGASPAATPASAARTRIDSGCIVWAAGVAASPLGRRLAAAAGLPPTEVDRAGRIKVLPDLGLPGHPEISVIGDLAAAQSHVPGQPPKPVPGVSPAAKQMGRTAARNLLHRLAGRPTEAFRYRDFGNLATIGRNSAVVDLATPLGPLRFSGYFAWLFWLFAHIYFLIGFRNRIVVLLDWASAYWSFERSARVVAGDPDTSPAEPARRAPPEA